MTGNRDTLFIEPDDRPRLAAAGLDTVGAALQCIGDQPVAWSRSTDTVRVDLPRSAGGGALFVKRYHHLEWRRRIKAMLRGTFFGRSRAHAEFDALKHLRARGAPMVRPIAFGERRVLHFLRSSFLITQAEPDTVSLTTFAQRHTNGRAPALDPKARRRLIECLGRFVGAFHRSGLVHGALVWRNVLVRRRGDAFEFVLVDAPGRKRADALRPHRKAHSIAGDLAGLAALASEFCTRTEQWRFYRAYRGDGPTGREDRRFIRDVYERAARLRPHELYRLEMNRIFHYHLVPADAVATTPPPRSEAVPPAAPAGAPSFAGQTPVG
jgi:hypothetical protein